MLVQRTLLRRFPTSAGEETCLFYTDDHQFINISNSHFPNCGDVWTPWNWTWATPPEHVIPLRCATISRTHHMCLVCSSHVICLCGLSHQDMTAVWSPDKVGHKIQQSVCCHQDAIRLSVAQLKSPWLSSIVWIYKRKRNVARQFQQYFEGTFVRHNNGRAPHGIAASFVFGIYFGSAAETTKFRIGFWTDGDFMIFCIAFLLPQCSSQNPVHKAEQTWANTVEIQSRGNTPRNRKPSKQNLLQHCNCRQVKQWFTVFSDSFRLAPWRPTSNSATNLLQSSEDFPQLRTCLQRAALNASLTKHGCKIVVVLVISV